MDCLVLGVFEEAELGAEARSVDVACGGRLKKLLARGDFSGRAGETLLVTDLPGIAATRVLLTGLGTQEAVPAQEPGAAPAGRAIARRRAHPHRQLRGRHRAARRKRAG